VLLQRLLQILHLLGAEGPKTASTPAKCIRSIYNRVLLENATVRRQRRQHPRALRGCL